MPESLVEVWQANAAGRYRHKVDQHGAPLDPNFSGSGRGNYRCGRTLSIRFDQPGAYPWGNHHNAWRPQHIHFSLFGAGLLTRLVTQMYFPGDPLLEFDPIFNSTADENARRRWWRNLTGRQPSRVTRWATGSISYCVGASKRRWRNSGGESMSASQTVGPFFSIGLEHLNRNDLAVPGISGTVVTIRGQILDGDRQPVPDAQLEIWQADAKGNYSENKCEAAATAPQNSRASPEYSRMRRAGSDFARLSPVVFRTRRRRTSAAHRSVRPHAWIAEAALHANFFPGEAANDSDPVLSLSAGRTQGHLGCSW